MNSSTSPPASSPLDERDRRLFFPTYQRLPIHIDRGEGVWLLATDGTRYLDMFGGIAVNALGYNHPAVNRAIREQVGRYLHLSNLYHQDAQAALAGRLLEASGYERVFFTNSGTEAMEGALKLARRWGRGRGKSTILGLTGSFHGRTLGALSVTGRQKYRDGYEPLLPGTGVVTFNDEEELRRTVTSETLAVVLEFIQGEGGINPVRPEYVEALDALRAQHGFLVIADEIQAGMGRTGKLFSFEHYAFRPDVVVASKALGGGLPLGAILAPAAIAEVFSPGTHGTTFGGNAVCCAAGLATLTEILDHGAMRNAAEVGGYLKTGLEQLVRDFPEKVAEARGMGLMLGLELRFEGTALVDLLREKGVLVLLTNGNIIRLLPPLILTKEDANLALRMLRECLEEQRVVTDEPRKD